MHKHMELMDEETDIHVNLTSRESGSQIRKWMPLVFMCFGILCLIISALVTGLHHNRTSSGFAPSCDNETQKSRLEMSSHQLIEERDRLKQMLQNIVRGLCSFLLDCDLIDFTSSPETSHRCLQQGKT